MSPLHSLLVLVFELSTSICHHSIQHHLSWFSSCCPRLNLFIQWPFLIFSESPLEVCPIYFLCLSPIVCVKALSSNVPCIARFFISLYSVQMIFSMFLQVASGVLCPLFSMPQTKVIVPWIDNSLSSGCIKTHCFVDSLLLTVAWIQQSVV